jgi:hypothetical protein
MWSCITADKNTLLVLLLLSSPDKGNNGFPVLGVIIELFQVPVVVRRSAGRRVEEGKRRKSGGGHRPACHCKPAPLDDFCSEVGGAHVLEEAAARDLVACLATENEEKEEEEGATRIP